MKIEVNIKKSYAFVIIGLLIALIGGIFVIAYSPGSTTANPAVFGHSANEIEVILPDGIVRNLSGAIGFLSNEIDSLKMAGGAGYKTFTLSYSFASSGSGGHAIPGTHHFCTAEDYQGDSDAEGGGAYTSITGGPDVDGKYSWSVNYYRGDEGGAYMTVRCFTLS